MRTGEGGEGREEEEKRTEGKREREQ